MTEKQKRFCDEYIIDLNATQAAIRAGYSPHTAKDIASQNLAKLNILAEINKKLAERSKRTGVNQDRVVRELAKIAFVNAADVIDDRNATVKPTATDDDRACIQSVKVKIMDSDKGTMEEREIKLADKVRALELLGKHLGMFKEKVELSTDEPSKKLSDILDQLGGEGLEE
nr:MAG TPA: Terminase small subunit [Bacteriophage sp.]